MAAQYVVGQVLPSGATVASDSLTTDADGTTTETMIAAYPNGAMDRTVIVTPGPNTPSANYATLQAKAQAALVNNATALTTLGAMTAPLSQVAQNQLVAIIAGLVKENSAIIRLLLNQTDTTTGT